MRRTGYQDLPPDLRPKSYDDQFSTPPDVNTEAGLHAAGESGIVPAETIFRLVARDSVLHQIRAEIGDFAALRFWRGAREVSARLHSGSTRPYRCQVFVPKSAAAKGAGWIVHEIGAENARRLCHLLGGAEVSLPNGSDIQREEAQRLALHMHRVGESVSAILEALKPTYPVEEGWVRDLLRNSDGSGKP
ncbi:MAG: hypothetical protein KDK11_15905 [Maritimibacter sp.]|nr:hypothetical protein [Maritimibacter sp.]